MACAAALAVLHAMEAERIPERAQRMGDRISSRFREWAGRFPCIGDVRGLGAMVGMELVVDRSSKTPDKALTTRFLTAALERGLVLLSSGTFGNVVRVLAPLTAQEAIIDEGLAVMESALAVAVSGSMESRAAGAAASAAPRFASRARSTRSTHHPTT